MSSPPTTGTGIGLGLTTFLLLGPQNTGLGQNTAIQWFEFAGAYVCAAALALSVYALIFPFRPGLRLRRLHQENCEQVYALLKMPATDENQFAFESRMVDRLTMMLGLLPAIEDTSARDLFEVSLGSMALGIALNQLRQQTQNNSLLSPDTQSRVLATVRETGRLVAARPDTEVDGLLDKLRALGDELDALHSSVHEHLWSVFRMRVALLIVVSFLERHRGHFESPQPQGAPALAH
ncbi:Fusaric acid resistance protein family protein [compost metagenome]